MQDFFIHLITNHDILVYVVIVVFACAEGPILSILFGVLIRAGYFHFLPVYAALMIGDLLGDCIWYYVGRRWGHKFVQGPGKHFGITETGVTKATAIFHRHRDKILIISKITNGFGLALVTLITAGMLRIPFRRYLGLNLLGQFVWSGILISTGYFFGHFYALIDKVFGRISAIGALVLACLCVIALYSFIKSKLVKELSEDEKTTAE